MLFMELLTSYPQRSNTATEEDRTRIRCALDLDILRKSVVELFRKNFGHRLRQVYYVKNQPITPSGKRSG